MIKLACGFAALVLLLAACGPSESELDGDLVVNGMEPVTWGVKIDKAAKTATIMVIGDRDIMGEPPVRSRGEQGVTTLTTKTPEGDLVMSVKPEVCRDGLTEREYNWSVLADWKGEQLKGCAGSPAAPG